MLRVAIILCIMGFETVKSDPVWMAPAQNVRRMALGVVDRKIRVVETDWNNTDYQQKADDKTVEIMKISEDIAQKISWAKYKAESSFNEMINGIKGVNITDCRHHYDNLNRRIDGILSHALVCVGNAMEALMNHTMTIDKMFINKRSRLDAVKRAIQNCNINIADQKSAIQAMRCTTLEKRNGEAISSAMGKRLKSTIDEVDGFMENVDRNLETCTIETGFETIDGILSIVVGIIDKCINQKINQTPMVNRKPSRNKNENYA